MKKRKKTENRLPLLAAAGLLFLCLTGAIMFWNRGGAMGEYEPVLGPDRETSGNTETGKGTQRQETREAEHISETEKIRIAAEMPEETLPETDSPNTGMEKAQILLDEMSLEEKAGQMFLVRYPEDGAEEMTGTYFPAGYIMFARDFEGKDDAMVSEEIRALQAAARTPLLIAADEEGGTVNRVSRSPLLRESPFLSPQQLYEEGGMERIESDTREKSRFLKELGINVNFAPVCDVSEDPEDFIYDRSFGKDAEQTSEYVRIVTETMGEEQMGCVLKHFPGYGNNEDTHTGMARDERSYETFVNTDFLPFQAGIAAGAPMVLVSHNVVSCMDQNRPASLSPAVHRILREELNFSGVIVTDDLDMEGVREFADDREAAVLAVEAGNDLLCCSDVELRLQAVLDAVESGRITEERINESVLRILNLKISLGIL